MKTHSTNTSLPLMQTAMKRQLMELPWTGNGLSLTKHLALNILAKEGSIQQNKLVISTLGHELLRSKKHWLTVNNKNNQLERYVGGVCTKPNQKNWH